MDKRTNNLLLIAGIGVAIYYFAQRTAAKISIGNAGVRIHKISFSNIELRIDLPVLNESQVPATVSAFLGQIFYKMTQIGVVTLIKPTDIPGFGQTSIQFRADISTISAGQAIYQILSNPPIDWKLFRIRGTLRVGPLPIGIDQSLIAA